MIYSVATASEDIGNAELRSALAQGDAVLQSAAPIMRHLLASSHHALFADEIVARVRGGVADVAQQLLGAGTDAGGPDGPITTRHERLVAALTSIPGFLSHLHALAWEWHLTERLQSRLALDPTLPPLLQELLGSSDAATSALGMNLLAAQARFGQTQRRMQLPLNELPADLLHGALVALRALSGSAHDAAAAETAIRSAYDEGRTRLALIARLVTGLGAGAASALALGRAGVAIFATALAIASGQDRDVIVLSTSEGQTARLALTLRAAGLARGVIEEQLLTLHSEFTLPPGWDRIDPDRAAAILAVAVPPAGS